QIADDPDTVEDESQPGYLSVFCRKSFQLGRLPPITNLILEVDYDDGFIAFLNGEEVARSASMGSAGVEFAFDDPADAGREAGTAEQFDLTARSSLLVQGTNVLAVQVHNRPITSTDLSFIPRLVVNVCPSVSGLTCAYDGAMDDVTLTFSLSAAADSVAVTRNGEPLPGSPFDPATTTVVDSSPGAFDNEYEVIPIFGSFSCGARSCTVECGDRDTGALTCVLSLVGGVTQAQLTWPTRAGAESIEVQREGALLATLPPSATSYLDPDVESDQPEGDTDYSVVFIFPSGDECTYSCAPICMIPSLVCTAVDGGGLYRPQLTWGPIIKEWESFTILRDGVEIATGLPGDAALYTDEDVDLIFGVAYDYELVPIAPAGEEVTDTCSTLTCTVSGPVDEAGSYDEPAGGWDYFIDFEALGSLQYNPVPGVEGNLDGDWVRSVDYDSWDGSAPDEFGAAPAGLAPGGLELRDVAGGGACGGPVKVLRILNPGNTTDPSAGTSVDEQFPDPYDEPNNSEILLAIDTGIADRNLLRDGVTFAARWRAHPEPPEYLNANPTGDGTPLDGGVGQIGFYFVDEPGDAGLGDEGGLAFSLQSSADSGQMQMSTNPAVTLPAAHIDVFRSIWVTVEDPEGDDTYDITVYVNGDETPFQSYTVTDAALQAGDPDFGAPVGNYLAIGVPGVNQDGDIEIDYVGYKAGVHAPTSTPCASGGARFVRGDADSNGTVNLTDGIRILSFLFTGGPAPECMDAADVDDSGGPQPAITDAIRLFGWLYLGQAAPAAPSPSAPTYAAGDCGIDPPGGPADTMDCVTPGPVCR
ncbi:MAG: hypothetical protein JXA90_02350, partial [Planctomycetes bacterium]|nr:hypothetical protein [Planctomycetota bacterium]